MKRFTGIQTQALAAAVLSLFFACAGTPATESGNGDPTPAPGKVIFAAPDAKTSGDGSIERPCTVHQAVEKAAKGWTIYLRGGEYALVKRLELNARGTEAEPIRMLAYNGEKPVFECSGLTEAVWSRQGIVLREGCYWYLQGIEVTGAYNEGFRIVNGSHNTFDRCVAHHNGGSGFSMSFGHEKPGEPLPNPDGEKAAWNTFVNCDSYNNFDWWTVNGGVPAAGTNADGFAVKQGSGRGNRFIGCRAWNNSDDAWDLYECGHAVEMTDCWAWHTGHREDHVDMYADRTGGSLTEEVWAGDGNGFKMGGGCLDISGRECRAYSKGTHLLRNCISFDNAKKGFDQNNHPMGAWIENCLSFGNGINFQFWKENTEGTGWVLRNNISMNGARKDQFKGLTLLADDHNSWNLGIKGKPADFVSLSAADAAAPRGADGSLPEHFGRLAPGSAFIDRGAPTKTVRGDGFAREPIPYNGSAPDLGAYEYNQ